MSMSSTALLDAQQRAFQQAVSEGADGIGLLHPGPGLAVYREAYSARLIAALRDNYAVLQRALGDETFDTLARAYVAAHPSRFASIRWFGDGLAAFMSSEWPELPHPALVDIARMDWALRAAFDGPDAPPLEAAALLGLAPEAWPGQVFQLHPCTALLPLEWAVEPAWRALRAHEEGEPDPELAPPEPLDHQLLIWRQQLETRWRALEPLEAALLQALAEGRDFAGICDRAAETVGAEQAAPTVVGLLQRWLADGLLTQRVAS
ncbi:DNA-binding domain-containing protein [Pelomonas sp. KK5]|uniref:HvfC/BufC N-terminal domain-containing protein n=1 Tax=Pelomonas sp. KK5 TaxID=1855730 RepID=UPI00117CCD70|nr:DNA-binding domain-containing protein [Pelomonas sp. KK5]